MQTKLFIHDTLDASDTGHFSSYSHWHKEETGVIQYSYQYIQSNFIKHWNISEKSRDHICKCSVLWNVS